MADVCGGDGPDLMGVGGPVAIGGGDVEVQGHGGKAAHDLRAFHLGETGGVVGHGGSIVGTGDHAGSGTAAESAATGAEGGNGKAFSRGSGHSAGHKAKRNEHGRNAAHQARYVHSKSSWENSRKIRVLPCYSPSGDMEDVPQANLSLTGGK